jgi:hypothetical protein
MPADAVLGLLRRHDPARALEPLDTAARDRLRATIVAAALRRSRRRVHRAVLVGAVAAVVLAAGGWTLYETVFAGPTAADVRTDFAQVMRTIPLPPGAHFRVPDLDEQGVYPEPETQARVNALLQATCAWFSYWRAGDPGARASALRAETRIRALMPVHREGMPEDAGGFDVTSFQAYDAIVAAQRRGDGAPTAEYLRANCS